MAYQSWDDLMAMSAKDPRLRILGTNSTNSQSNPASQISSMGATQPGSIVKQPSQVKPDGAMMAAIEKRMKKNQKQQLDPTATTNPTPTSY